jgi:hypothetical protein
MSAAWPHGAWRAPHYSFDWRGIALLLGALLAVAVTRPAIRQRLRQVRTNARPRRAPSPLPCARPRWREKRKEP